MYKAQNIDTDLALEAIEHRRNLCREEEYREKMAIEKYYSGINKGLEIAESLFKCSNYEKDDAPDDTPAESEWTMEQNHGLIKCKNCGKEAARPPLIDEQWETPYCPCCGAKMKPSIILEEARP